MHICRYEHSICEYFILLSILFHKKPTQLTFHFSPPPHTLDSHPTQPTTTPLPYFPAHKISCVPPRAIFFSSSLRTPAPLA